MQKKKKSVHAHSNKKNRFYTAPLNNLIQAEMYKCTRIGVVRLLCRYIFISALIQIHTARQLITPPVCLWLLRSSPPPVYSPNKSQAPVDFQTERFDASVSQWKRPPCRFVPVLCEPTCCPRPGCVLICQGTKESHV